MKDCLFLSLIVSLYVEEFLEFFGRNSEEETGEDLSC